MRLCVVSLLITAVARSIPVLVVGFLAGSASALSRAPVSFRVSNVEVGFVHVYRTGTVGLVAHNHSHGVRGAKERYVEKEPVVLQFISDPWNSENFHTLVKSRAGLVDLLLRSVPRENLADRTQDFWLEVFRRQVSDVHLRYDPTRTKFNTYLGSVARGVVTNGIRKDGYWRRAIGAVVRNAPVDVKYDFWRADPSLQMEVYEGIGSIRFAAEGWNPSLSISVGTELPASGFRHERFSLSAALMLPEARQPVVQVFDSLTALQKKAWSRFLEFRKLPRDQVESLAEKLTPNQLRVFLYRYGSGLRWGQIGSLLGIRPTTARWDIGHKAEQKVFESWPELRTQSRNEINAAMRAVAQVLASSPIPTRNARNLKRALARGEDVRNMLALLLKRRKRLPPEERARIKAEVIRQYPDLPKRTLDMYMAELVPSFKIQAQEEYAQIAEQTGHPAAALLRRVQAGDSIGAIAESLETTPSSIKTQLQRARAELKEPLLTSQGVRRSPLTPLEQRVWDLRQTLPSDEVARILNEEHKTQKFKAARIRAILSKARIKMKGSSSKT